MPLGDDVTRHNRGCKNRCRVHQMLDRWRLRLSVHCSGACGPPDKPVSISPHPNGWARTDIQRARHINKPKVEKTLWGACVLLPVQLHVDTLARSGARHLFRGCAHHGATKTERRRRAGEGGGGPERIRDSNSCTWVEPCNGKQKLSCAYHVRLFIARPRNEDRAAEPELTAAPTVFWLESIGMYV